ncbi:MAG: inosine/xanthosine triphosphatase [Candidatus Pacebacteria bacterium]|nr:inosine/xanthosine triphosphatase [Candidatus Paceibacterota bacterium]
MLIFVGSKNPVKINSVINAGSEAWPELKVVGIDVPSGINEQPMSDDETRQGAENRAKFVLKDGLKTLSKKEIQENTILGIGLEGGVFEKIKGELWSTVWATVVDQKGNLFESNGARFKVPNIIADRILAGEEMGPIMGSFFSDPNLKQKQGAIGAITKGFIDRTEEYTIIVKLALGLYFGQGWDKEITSTKK